MHWQSAANEDPALVTSYCVALACVYDRVCTHTCEHAAACTLRGLPYVIASHPLLAWFLASTFSMTFLLTLLYFFHYLLPDACSLFSVDYVVRLLDIHLFLQWNRSNFQSNPFPPNAKIGHFSSSRQLFLSSSLISKIFSTVPRSTAATLISRLASTFLRHTRFETDGVYFTSNLLLDSFSNLRLHVRTSSQVSGSAVPWGVERKKGHGMAMHVGRWNGKGGDKWRRKRESRQTKKIKRMIVAGGWGREEEKKKRRGEKASWLERRVCRGCIDL